ncbi:MAG: / family protein [Paenibacillaceae bacterium]|jgi:hypothetical protein|nr:/ family protein [Paenibacillaceae bacterium]
MITIHPNVICFDRLKFDSFKKMIDSELEHTYEKFLMEFNGGEPTFNIFTIKNAEKNGIQQFSVRNFFGIGIQKDDDLLIQLEVFKERLPKDVIPIARTEGGNILCINLTENDYAQIVLFDHELEEVIFVCNTFEEFLNDLQPYENINLEGYTVKKVWIDPDFLKSLNQE